MKIPLSLVFLVLAVVWAGVILLISPMYPVNITCAVPMYPIYDLGIVIRSLVLYGLIAAGIVSWWFNLEVEISVKSIKEETS